MALVLLAPASHAEEQRLGEVVVTAPPAPAEAPPKDATSFGTVIDTTTAPTRVESLADVLASTVGVQVRRFGGLGDFSTVSVRGFSPGQVQVYLDGVPLTRADNEVVNLSELPPDALERIEVYRGTTPLAFSQSGPGGVVNLVPRRAGTTPLRAASVGWGSFGTRKADLALSGSRGQWDGLAFVHYLGSVGDFPFDNEAATPALGEDPSPRRTNNDFDLGNVTARLGWHPAPPLRFRLTTDNFVKEGGQQGIAGVQTRDARRETVRTLTQLSGHLDPQGPASLSLDASLWGLFQRQRFHSPTGEPIFGHVREDDRTASGGGQLLARAVIGAHHLPGLLLAAGTERFTQRSGVQSARVEHPGEGPDQTRFRATVAAEDEILMLAERLSVVPALRWELFQDEFPADTRLVAGLRESGSHTTDVVSPRIGLRADAGWGFVVLANLGRYSRVPNLVELFGTSGVVRGNPDLRRERSSNRDAGFRWTLPSPRGPLAVARLEYAYFDNTIDDLIVPQPVGVGLFRFENVGKAHVSGHEISTNARLWDWLDLSLNYTAQDARDESEVPFYHGKQLPGRPSEELYARVEVRWSAGALEVLGPGRFYYELDHVGGNFLDRVNHDFVDDRTYHSIGLEVGLPPRGTRLGVELRNAGDDQTRDALDFPLPGRALFVTLSYGFGRDASP